ncbi:hypothetical protein J421_6159 (plasmid) [Gemmatirosa kalamazoonensis]|uniref:Lipoprotein n=1 Tax=Gemmatirosa kalamazoonensis TaxID=861299 RepID=W0RRV6_9BACT|nr:hypothetical protein [Gemmatirosa kalamazoonensis]AHG93694.1 hypothetical protein J421_6159 [Gemmatirosa kalamazoonensis]
MQHGFRTRALLALVFVAGCSGDVPTHPRAPSDARAPSRSLAPTPDAQVGPLLAALFPSGLEAVAATRWDALKRRVAAGQTAGARSVLAELVAWIDRQTPGIAALTPALCDGAVCETVPSVAAKVKLYMTAYVYGLVVPNIPTGVDFGGGLVLPGTDPAPIITLNQLAGVDLKPLSVDVPTLITIVENRTRYPLCGGPLATTLCQLPRFYRFDASPHVKLNVPADFAVCHTKPAALPWGTTNLDARIRVAHDRPTSASDDTPGAIRTGGIEILAYTPITFLHCEDHTNVAFAAPASALEQRGWALLGALWSAVAPRTAWAIDLGGGGQSLSFSNFNLVDPVPRRRP